MPTFERSTHLPVSAADAYAWHSRDGALQRLAPPGLQLLWSRGTFEERRLAMRPGPGQPVWQIAHQDAVVGQVFADVQLAGPMHRWRHEHRFEPISASQCRLVDRITWELPLPPLGRWVAGWWLRGMLHGMFADRHRLTRDDLRQHARWQQVPRLRVLVVGAASWIGAAAAAYLSTAGHAVRLLTPSELAMPQADLHSFGDLDAVLDLSDAGLAACLGPLPRKARQQLELERSWLALAGGLRAAVAVQASALGVVPGLGLGARSVQLQVPAVLPDRAGLQVRGQPAVGPMPWIALQDLLGVLEAALCDPAWQGSVMAAAPTLVTPGAWSAAVALSPWGARDAPRLAQAAGALTGAHELGYAFLYPELAGAVAALAVPAEVEL